MLLIQVKGRLSRRPGRWFDKTFGIVGQIVATVVVVSSVWQHQLR
jgi:hypothetical protein